MRCRTDEEISTDKPRFGSGQGLRENIVGGEQKLDVIPPDFLDSLTKDLNGLYGIRYVQDRVAKSRAYSKYTLCTTENTDLSYLLQVSGIPTKPSRYQHANGPERCRTRGIRSLVSRCMVQTTGASSYFVLTAQRV